LRRHMRRSASGRHCSLSWRDCCKACEVGGATAILVESAPEGRRGFYAGWQNAGQPAGFLLAAVVAMVVTLSMTPAQIESGGWRWPFALGLLIAPVGLYIRSKLDDPAVFLKARGEAGV